MKTTQLPSPCCTSKLMSSLLLLHRGQVAVGFEQPVVVEPPGPFERSELDVLHVAPRASSADNLCLEEPDDRFGHGIVVRIAAAADGRLDACLGEPLGVADREVLHPAVAVMNEPIRALVLALADRLLERVEREVAP